MTDPHFYGDGHDPAGQRGRWRPLLPWLFAVLLTAACAGGCCVAGQIGAVLP